MEIDFRDIEIETYTAGSVSTPGTTHAVRVCHKPTGYVATCDRYKSNLENRNRAFDELKQKLLNDGLSHQYTVALDFDGVLHQYSKKWHDGSIYDPPVKGTKSAIKYLADNYDLIIFSCRVPTQDIEAWTEEQFGVRIPATNEKPHADMYIDDRGYHFNGNWDEALDELHRRHGNGFTQWQ